MEIICYEFELCLNNGIKYKIVCGSNEIDKLSNLIGEENILYIEEK